MMLGWLVSAALAQGWDVGSRTSAVLEGFEALTPASEAWVKPPRKILAGTAVDALADGASGGRLRLDVPDGTWSVAIRVDGDAVGVDGFGGPGQWRWFVEGVEQFVSPGYADGAAWLASEDYGRSCRSVWRPGETAWDRVLQPRHRWLQATVKVEDGLQLHVEGRPLEAILVAPDPAALSARLQAAEASAREDHRAHTPQVPWTPVVGTGLEFTGWGQEPTGATTEAISLAAAVDDRVGGILWVPDGSAATVSVRGLSALEVHLDEVMWVDGPGRPGVASRFRPGAVVPLGARSGALVGGQGVPAGVGLRIHVPPGTRPGTHKGKLKVGRQAVPVVVEVPEWSLDPALPVGTFLYVSTSLTTWDGPNAPSVQRAIDDALELHASRGLHAIAIDGTLTGHERGYPVERDPVLEHLMARWEALGGRALSWTDPKRPLRHDAFLTDGPVISDENLDALRRRLALLSSSSMDVVVPLYEEEGWKHAGRLDRTAAFVELARTVRPPNVRFSSHMAHPVSWAIADAFDVVGWNGFPVANRETADRLRNAEGGLWTYNLTAGRGAGIRAWHLGAEAHLEWRFNNIDADPCGRVTPGENSGFGMLAPDGSTWSTVWFERLAMGVSDARYLATLQRWTAEDGCAPDAGVQDWLETVRVSLDEAADLASEGREIWPESTFDAVRREAIRHLQEASDRCE